MTTQERVRQLQPYAHDAYKQVDLNRLTALVISVLTDMDIPTSIENIAVASFRLFPARFQMCDYPEFPDLTRTNRALLQLRPKYRGWATGSTKSGFVLNAAGEDVARTTKGILSSTTLMADAKATPGGRREAGKATIDKKAYVTRIRQSACFRKFQDNEKPRGLDFLDMLNSYSHTPPEEIRRSLRLIETIAGDESDEAVLRFVKWCRQMFTSYLVDDKKEKKTR